MTSIDRPASPDNSSGGGSSLIQDDGNGQAPSREDCPEDRGGSGGDGSGDASSL